MSNSSLATITRLADKSNYTSQRTKIISMYIRHCVAGNLSVESTLALFQNAARDASCNYAIGSDGRIGLGVNEENRAWTTSSGDCDHRGITIEIANSNNVQAEPWPVTDQAREADIKLAVDVAQRNDIPGYIFSGNKDTSTWQAHRWYANKSCPGNQMFNRSAEDVKEINKRLGINKARVRVCKQDTSDAYQNAFRAGFIKEMQAMLNKIIQSGLTEDGKWGAATDTAVKSFQQKNNLIVESICGRRMWDKMDELLNKPAIDLGTGDNPSSWAKEATTWAKEQGLFNGDGKGNYDWQGNMTREQVAQVLYNQYKRLK